MKKSLPLLGAALVLALLVTGCETTGSSARIQEKSAVYATLKPWQKNYVDKGIIAMNFTPDMVYMSIGNPSTKQTTDDGELWTYKNYYPTVEADKVKRTYSTDSSFQPTRLQPDAATGRPQPVGMGQGGSGPSIGTTGGPQGSMELGDLQSYTLYVNFKDGVVNKMKLNPN